MKVNLVEMDTTRMKNIAPMTERKSKEMLPDLGLFLNKKKHGNFTKLVEKKQKYEINYYKPLSS